MKLGDGQLQASEIIDKLRINADLVVLAACETGRSEVLRGDEILGLTRALLYSGTPAVLVTAWKVHELSTRLFIERFFELLKAEEPEQQIFDPAGALSLAQVWLRSLTYAETSAQMEQWSDMDHRKIELYLSDVWSMQKDQRPLKPDSQLFSHPFFWAPYMLIGEPAPKQSKSPNHHLHQGRQP